MPTARSSQEEIERALHVLASCDSRYRIYRRLAGRARVALDPLSCWLLVLDTDQEPISQENLAKRLAVPGEQLRPARESLIQNELITVFSPSEGQASGQLQLTPAGQQTLDKLAAAYHESLAELLDGWSPE